jgi:hypothetical protein
MLLVPRPVTKSAAVKPAGGRCQADDLAADEVAVQVGVVEGGRPHAVGDEGAAGRGRAAGVVVIRVDGVRHPGRRGTAVGPRALAHGPSRTFHP